MKLVEILTNPTTIYFLGAGASWDSGLPLGDKSAYIIIRKAFSHVNRLDLWEKIDQLAGSKEEVLWPRFEVLLDVFSEYIPHFPLEIVKSFKNVGLSSTHQLLARKCNGPHLWLTTNFDDQIERCLTASGQSFRVITDIPLIEYLNDYDLQDHLIVKLHGDVDSIDSENSLGVRIDQILKTFPEKSKKSLMKLANKRPILFIGYAARDPDLFEIVEDLITNAQQVAWIGLNEASDQVKALISKNKKIQYYADGAPLSLTNEIKENVPKAITEEKKWQKQIDLCILTKSIQDVAQVLSTICLERNGKESRKAAEELLHLIHDDNPNHILWKIDKQIELLFRSTQPEQSEIKIIKDKLDSFISTLAYSQTSLIINTLLTLSNIYWRTSELIKAEEILMKALDLCEMNKCSELRIKTLTELGIVRVYIGSDSTQTGLENLKQAQCYANQENKPILEVEAAHNLAICYMKVDQSPLAEELLLQMGNIVDEIGNPRRKLIWMLNLAESYRFQRKFIKAIKTNQELLYKAQIFCDNEIIMNASNNMGLCFIVTGNVPEAEKAILLSLDSAEQVNNGVVINNAYYNLGWLRVLLGLWGDAIPYFEKAITGYRMLGLQEMEGGSMSLMVWCKYCLGSTAEARRLFNDIKERQNEPKYLFRSEYNLVNYVLSFPEDIQHIYSQINNIFNNEPEQKFLLLAWMLDNHIKQLTKETIEKYLKIALETADKSGFNIFYSVLIKIVNKRDDISKQLYDLIIERSSSNVVQ